MQKSKAAKLVLENGIVFHGYSFGYEQSKAGEVVFNTAMMGYPESLTDPSYSGQILVFTFPLIGNYGVPSSSITNNIADFFESEKIHASGVVVSTYSFEYSHWNAQQSLGDWLVENKVPGIYGIDTRELTKVLRDKGAMKGKIIIEDNDIDFVDSNSINQVDIVSCKEIMHYGNGKKKVVLVDCGVKHNIIRCLLKRDVTLIRVPWNYDFNMLEYDALFLSNGPGDPSTCELTVQHIRKAMEREVPIFGICMGNQLLAKAGGANTYKLKYGHRSHNQPVRLVGENRCFVTSQNHGYAVDDASLSNDWKPYFVNMNDDTNEGIKHATKPFFSVQFHPEATSGPTDTEFLFDEFINLID
ncbi:MAG: glutamine-hydrolyzing carbamoyl-phosphate synthase small subunit [Paludibacteraceae bacterium]|nr:glutamine-hydrolyzing carbamoyl-phosphate synthase small subunit [Paludibacteraceae bacterium]MBP6284446.1 glutamine-hydrolyzing carbamoyl-phosphate synthase small subunit [Paludibacteraceae bacterium]